MDKFKLKRYEQNHYESRCYESSGGKWVKWKDVKPLLEAYSSLIDKSRRDKLGTSGITGFQ